MSGNKHHIVPQWQQLPANRVQQLLVIATRKIGAADRTPEQDINLFYRDTGLVNGGFYALDIATGIHYSGAIALFTDKQRAVLLECSDGNYDDFQQVYLADTIENILPFRLRLLEYQCN